MAVGAWYFVGMMPEVMSFHFQIKNWVGANRPMPVLAQWVLGTPQYVPLKVRQHWAKEYFKVNPKKPE